jgi:hypothetical protein
MNLAPKDKIHNALFEDIELGLQHPITTFPPLAVLST